jgi:ribosomal protein S5
MAKQRRDGSSGHGKREKRDEEFDQVLIDVARVTRVMAGGKRMSSLAWLLATGPAGWDGDVQAGCPWLSTAVTAPNIIKVKMINDTIPCFIYESFGGEYC